MKKLLALALCLIVALGAFGCATEEVLLSVTPTCWTAGQKTYESVYEKSTFEVVKKNAAGVEVAKGTLTYTLEFDSKSDDEIPKVYNRLITDFTITYNDNAQAADKGKTDTITSKCVFNASVLLPTYSEKTVTLADREGVTNNSYHIENDYLKKTSVLTWTKSERQETLKNFKGQQSDVYDNEMLYYLIRAISDIKPGAGTVAINVANPFESHIGGKYATYPFNCTTSAEGKDEALSYPTLASFVGNETGALSAMSVNLTLNRAKESGPNITLKYSTTPFKVSDSANNEKVLVYISTVEYDVLNAQKAFVTEYTLKDYSINPQA